jgi:hypothetical protein
MIFQMNNKPAGFFFPLILDVLVSSLIYFYRRGWELGFSCGFCTLLDQFFFLVYLLSFCASFLLLLVITQFLLLVEGLVSFPSSLQLEEKKTKLERKNESRWKDRTFGIGTSLDSSLSLASVENEVVGATVSATVVAPKQSAPHSGSCESPVCPAPPRGSQEKSAIPLYHPRGGAPSDTLVRGSLGSEYPRTPPGGSSEIKVAHEFEDNTPVQVTHGVIH